MGIPEIILIVLVIILFFGARKIPEIAKGLGQGIREFRKTAKDIRDEAGAETKKTDENNTRKQ